MKISFKRGFQVTKIGMHVCYYSANIRKCFWLNKEFLK